MTLFFFTLSYPVNHLMNPQIYLVTPWLSETPGLGTSALVAHTAFVMEFETAYRLRIGRCPIHLCKLSLAVLPTAQSALMLPNVVYHVKNISVHDWVFCFPCVTVKLILRCAQSCQLLLQAAEKLLKMFT